MTVMGSMAATIMSIRQLACIEVDCTLPQAERYCRLVRFIDRSKGINPWVKIRYVNLNDCKYFIFIRNYFLFRSDLSASHPKGLISVLSAIDESEGEDDGEPIPSELGPSVEPIALAKSAFDRSSIVRRNMYDRWISNQALLPSELIQITAEEDGRFALCYERYLLIRRYCDWLPARKRDELLNVKRVSTLEMAAHIRDQIRQGLWRDPGEPNFNDVAPPPVIDEQIVQL